MSQMRLWCVKSQENKKPYYAYKGNTRGDICCLILDYAALSHSRVIVRYLSEIQLYKCRIQLVYTVCVISLFRLQSGKNGSCNCGGMGLTVPFLPPPPLHFCGPHVPL